MPRTKEKLEEVSTLILHSKANKNKYVTSISSQTVDLSQTKMMERESYHITRAHLSFNQHNNREVTFISWFDTKISFKNPEFNLVEVS